MTAVSFDAGDPYSRKVAPDFGLYLDDRWACLAVLAGTRREEAVGWVRANYCPDAVETLEQTRFVETFGV